MRTRRVGAGSVVIATLAMTVATSITDAASGESGSPPKTIPTLPPTSTSETTGDVSTGIQLRAAASLPEFLPVVHGIIGATSDVAGELAVVAEVPQGIMSPDGSSIRQFSVAYNALDERFVATATFSSDATPEDAVVFYQATLAAAGFTPVSDSGRPENGETTRQLQFENPNSRLHGASVEVTVTDAGETEIELTITDAIAPDVLNAFTGWAAGLPTLVEATPIGAEMLVTTGSSRNDLTMTLSTLFGYTDYTPEELAAALRAALPTGGFSTTDEDTGSGTDIAMRHITLEDLNLEISAANTDSSRSNPDGSSPATTFSSTLLLSATVRL